MSGKDDRGTSAVRLLPGTHTQHMAQVHHATSLTARGPWLVSLEALRELSDIFATTAAKVAKSPLPSPVARNSNSLKFELELSDGRVMSSDDFNDLSASPDLARERPLSFVATLSTQDGVYQVALTKNAKRLRAEAPQSAPRTHAFLAAIREWVSRHGPSRLASAWLRFRVLLWAALIMALMILTSDERHPSAGKPWQSKAIAFAANGVRPDDVPEALRTLLAMQVPASSLEAPSSSRASTYWLVALAVCIVLTICPNVVVGLGRGEARIKAWQLWMRLVLYSVPALVFTTVLWPVILERLGVASH